MTNSAWTKH